MNEVSGLFAISAAIFAFLAFFAALLRKDILSKKIRKLLEQKKLLEDRIDKLEETRPTVLSAGFSESEIDKMAEEAVKRALQGKLPSKPISSRPKATLSDPALRRFGFLEAAIMAAARNVKTMNGVVLALFSGPLGLALQQLESRVVKELEMRRKTVSEANSAMMTAEGLLRKLTRSASSEPTEEEAMAYVEENFPKASYSEKLREFDRYMAEYPQRHAQALAEAREAVETASEALKNARAALKAFEGDPVNVRALERLADLQAHQDAMRRLGPSLEELERNIKRSRSMPSRHSSSFPPPKGPSAVQPRPE